MHLVDQEESSLRSDDAGDIGIEITHQMDEDYFDYSYSEREQSDNDDIEQAPLEAVPLNPEEMSRHHQNILRSESSYMDNIPSVDAISERGVIQATDDVPIASDIVAIGSHPHNTMSGDREASIMSLRVFKFTRGEKLGILMKVVDGHLTISRIARDGLLNDSPLRPGQRILRINGEYCLGWSPFRAVDYLKEIMGPVTIVVENLQGNLRFSAAAVLKKDLQQGLGITLKKGDHHLKISKINQMGLLGHDSVIDIDDQLVAINDIPCDNMETPSIAVEILNSIQGWITIVTERARESHMLHTNMLSERHIIETGFSTGRYGDAEGVVSSGVEASLVHSNGESRPSNQAQAQTSPAYISALFYKADEKSKIAIKEVHISDEKLKVSSINPADAKSSPIKAGHELVALDGKPCSSWSVHKFHETINAAKGFVNIVAHNPYGDPFLVEAMLTKRDKNDKIGLTFVLQDNDTIRIKKINENSLATNSVLNARDYVQSVNGISCEGKSPGWISTFIARCPDTVVIFAKTLRSTAVVISHGSTRNAGSLVPPSGTAAAEEEAAEARRLAVFKAICFSVLVIAATISLLVAFDGLNPDDDYYR